MLHCLATKNDLRIITTNYNIYPHLRIPFIPFKAYRLLMFWFPMLFDWTLPDSLSSINSRFLCSLIMLMAVA